MNENYASLIKNNKFVQYIPYLTANIMIAGYNKMKLTLIHKQHNKL